MRGGVRFCNVCGEMMAYRHRLVFVTFTLAMLLYIDRIAISTAKTSITGAFSLSDTQFGWILSAFALGYALSQIPAGVVVDRFGPRLVLALIVGVWSLFTGLTGLAFGFISLLVIRTLFGMAEAGAWPACARAFYSWLPPGERGFAKSVNMSGSRLGSAFALPAVAWLITALGWHAAFGVLAAAGLVWARAGISGSGIRRKRRTASPRKSADSSPPIAAAPMRWKSRCRLANCSVCPTSG